MNEIRDKDGNFEGFTERACGDHRTVGDYRAWCYDCSEWCYPDAPCVRCQSRSDCPHQWQPIETAPKDGTEVFVAYVDGYRAIGFFVGERWRERYTETICYPTHWMPLPPLPEVTE
jgi:hypothetical protein